jgi:hypothetical protein
MKKYHFYSGLLLTSPPLSARCKPCSPTLSNAQAQTNQAILYTIFGKIRLIPGWQFDELDLLKAIKDRAARLRHNHQHPHKNIIKLEYW